MIALPNDEEEIPEEPQRRLELVRKIVDVATGTYGIPLEDIVIDPLAMPVGADTSLVLSTLETIRLVRDEFGLNMTLGASNVSFGMPDKRINRLGIYTPHGGAVRADQRDHGRALAAAGPGGQGGRPARRNKDPWGASWIAAHRALQARQAQQAQPAT